MNIRRKRKNKGCILIFKMKDSEYGNDNMDKGRDY
jgi:hypothetical protein